MKRVVCDWGHEKVEDCGGYCGQPNKVTDEPSRENFSLRLLADPQVMTITGFPPYDGQWVRYKPPLVLPTEACVIRAKVTSWPHPRILFGHPNPGEDSGMTFCRAVDGLSYSRDEIVSFEVLWVDDKDDHA